MAYGDLVLPAGLSSPAVHLFDVDDYHRMGEAGILSGDERVELIEGVVVTMAPIGSPHFAAVLRLNRLLSSAAGGRATVSVQGPVRLPPRSEPEPDLALLHPRADDYAAALPGPADVLLLVEVADTTLKHDRDVKGPLYARHGIPEYWLVDLNAREVLVHRDPVPAEGRWRSIEPAGADAVLEVTTLPGATVAVASVLA